MHHYRLFLNITSLTIILLFIAGCSSRNDVPVRTKLNIQASFPKGGSTASGQPIKSFKTQGELSAYIRIRGLNGDQFNKMEIKDDRAIFSIDDLPPATYSIDIEFRYQTEEYGSVTLLEATRTITIIEGGTSLTFNEESYLYLDDDDDNISNYEELKNGTNLNKIEDTTAPLTTALINDGEITSETGISYIGPQQVTLKCTEQGSSVFASGCNITYYTTDKSDPKTSPTRIEYSTSILVEETTTLKYYSVDYVGNKEPSSSTVELIILPNDESAPKTKLTPPPGTYQGLIRVQAECTDTGGSGCDDMYYTVDGSNPKTSPTRTKYADTSIVISETIVLKFYSVDNAGNEEETQTVDYIITNARALSRSIKPPATPYLAAETYSVNLGNTTTSFSAIHPSGNFAYHIENSKVSGFQLKPASTQPILELKTQNTPISIAIHPSGKFAYIVSNNKDSSSITAYKVNKKTGAWNKTDSPLYNLPIHAKIITIAPSGNFLYLLIDQNIITYNINHETGKITESSNQYTVLTATPSAALISQSGEQLYIRYQVLDMIEKYTIDTQTGALDGPTKQLPVNSTTVPKTMLIRDQSFYLIDSHYPLFTKSVDNYVETFW